MISIYCFYFLFFPLISLASLCFEKLFKFVSQQLQVDNLNLINSLVNIQPLTWGQAFNHWIARCTVYHGKNFTTISIDASSRLYGNSTIYFLKYLDNKCHFLPKYRFSNDSRINWYFLPKPNYFIKVFWFCCCCFVFVFVFVFCFFLGGGLISRNWGKQRPMQPSLPRTSRYVRSGSSECRKIPWITTRPIGWLPRYSFLWSNDTVSLGIHKGSGGRSERAGTI